jgi:uracil-DNA glycosylase
VIVGLAPAAHGANRTGRAFTGDRSGDFLFAGLHRAGFANQPASTDREDGLVLTDAWISIAGRCAPPGNKPTPEELATCAPFLDKELALLKPRVVLALGAIGWSAVLGAYSRAGVPVAKPLPKFGHGAEVPLEGGPVLVGSYHVSQQNTQTGRLAPVMFDRLLVRVRALLDSSDGASDRRAR